jgi:NAD-dependent DNA ligase
MKVEAMKEIIPPTNCPECSSNLLWVNDQLYCKNSSCPARTLKALQHFTKTAKIKGLGEASLLKLEINSIVELYQLSKQDFIDALGEKNGIKCYNELEKSKKLPLNMLLPAFNIPLIGNTASSKICSKVSHIDEITESSLKDAGIGPKASANLLNWLNKVYKPMYENILPFDFKSSNVVETNTEDSKGTVCITGKLKTFKTKAEAEQALHNNGYSTVPRMTKAVDILVNESGIESAKTEKARESGVTIVTNLNQLLGD